MIKEIISYVIITSALISSSLVIHSINGQSGAEANNDIQIDKDIRYLLVSCLPENNPDFHSCTSIINVIDTLCKYDYFENCFGDLWNNKID